MQDFSSEALQNYFKALENAPTCRVFDCLDSTNNEARRMSADGFFERALIVAAEQTGGRGRMGRSFYSPAETGAYFSILYTPTVPLADAVRITGAASVAVMRAIKRLTGKQTAIKWVNDLYYNERKVCGILTEAVTGERGTQVIVGIGINLSTDVFPQELSGIAGGLCAEHTSILETVAAVYRELEAYLDHADDTSWLPDYRAHSMVIGRAITWERGGERFSGRAVGIDDEGALLVQNDAGEDVRLSTGEISLRLSEK